MNKSIIVIMAFVGFIAVSFAFTNADQPRYKNLKVLPKNVTKEQLDSVMHNFSGSLGVKCSYCHAYNEQQKSMDFASDEKKEKGAARGMLHMMYKLNKKFFDIKNSKDLTARLEVTCYSCHHGSPHPGTKPPMAMRQQEPPPPGGQQPNLNDSTKH